MSVLRSHNNKTRGGLGRVCVYRSIEHVKFPKFQIGIFVEWKAPMDMKVAWVSGVSGEKGKDGSDTQVNMKASK